MEERPRAGRDEYPHYLALPTRWIDNDVYGHVNNALYYAFFDTAINQYLITEGGPDIARDPVIGFAAETHRRFLRPVAFPQVLGVGLRVARLGNSSVRYELAIFAAGEAEAAAIGYFVHVFVDRASGRPVPVPAPLRAALERLVAAAP